MRCPFCASTDTHVKDSRPSDEYKSVRRRRECSNCKRRFTTFERFQAQQIVVIKRNGGRELFDREKIMKSLILALRKRQVPQVELNTLVADIEQSLTEGSNGEVESSKIGQEVLSKLKKVDFIGYVRYASVYDGFKTVSDFEKLLKDVMKK